MPDPTATALADTIRAAHARPQLEEMAARRMRRPGPVGVEPQDVEASGEVETAGRPPQWACGSTCKLPFGQISVKTDLCFWPGVPAGRDDRA
jgi:hypothetical protein